MVSMLGMWVDFEAQPYTSGFDLFLFFKGTNIIFYKKNMQTTCSMQIWISTITIMTRKIGHCLFCSKNLILSYFYLKTSLTPLKYLQTNPSIQKEFKNPKWNRIKFVSFHLDLFFHTILRLQNTTIKPISSHETHENKNKKLILVVRNGLNNKLLSYHWNSTTPLSFLALTKLENNTTKFLYQK